MTPMHATLALSGHQVTCPASLYIREDSGILQGTIKPHHNNYPIIVMEVRMGIFRITEVIQYIDFLG